MYLALISQRMPKLVALHSSTPRQGKSTLAKHLTDSHFFVTVSFADPVKKIMVEILKEWGVNPISAWNVYYNKDTVIPEVGKTGRYLLQTFATNWAREMVDQDIWVRTAESKISRLLADGFSVVVDDLRFLSEEKMLRRLGVKTLKVVRDSGALLYEGNHSSEGNQVPFHHIIDNNGPIENSIKQLCEVLNLN
ncbi:deoxynucleotide monophosphate kinase [Synechococcus phage S-CBWM1]|uniref:Deoxynucleotide monophosphate kinase n=1 Tax=Synechococcus phage S-CBWM1 TaxID=2053653 RepID=A0A3G1L3U3_9CAUD|nr:deoxynucleotide monophosphate kinase [Synechococcus phage S-CBWM1]ATW62847.1 deoxynucleotide monophosphate kinase [Synechococcus phage S-CBWM1]